MAFFSPSCIHNSVEHITSSRDQRHPLTGASSPPADSRSLIYWKPCFSANYNNRQQKTPRYFSDGNNSGQLSAVSVYATTQYQHNIMLLTSSLAPGISMKMF